MKKEKRKVAAIPSRPGKYRLPSGDRYIRTPEGQIINADGKPWRNKAERKQYIKARRELRKQTPRELAMAS